MHVQKDQKNNQEKTKSGLQNKGKKVTITTTQSSEEKKENIHNCDNYS
jgi:hypothetical protein